MNSIFLEEVREGWLTICMDDMLIHTDGDVVSHRKVVHRVLDKLQRHDLFLKPEKCLFEQKRMEFLGIVLKGGTIQMDPAKIQGVSDQPRPKSVRDVDTSSLITPLLRARSSTSQRKPPHSTRKHARKRCS